VVLGGDALGAALALARPAASGSAIRPLGSLWCERRGALGSGSGEWAADARGRWRGEALWRPAAAGPAFGARLGHAAFDGAESGATARPGAVIGVSWEGHAATIAPRFAASQWHFGRGEAGSRVTLEVTAALPHHDRVAWGVEERHGSRRESAGATGTFRQGAWVGWSGGPEGLVFSVRHESWMRRGGFRDPARQVATIGLTARPLPRVELGASVTLFHSRSGEPQYLSEIESDRRVLRALSGTGRRLRAQCAVPALAGRVHAAVTVPEAAGRARSPQWTVDWTRRERTR
jgi:hypothetical protein